MTGWYTSKEIEENRVSEGSPKDIQEMYWELDMYPDYERYPYGAKIDQNCQSIHLFSSWLFDSAACQNEYSLSPIEIEWNGSMGEWFRDHYAIETIGIHFAGLI